MKGFLPSLEISPLVEMLRTRARESPAAQAFSFLSDAQGESAREDRISYAGLDERARAIAALLLAHGARGERVLLLYPPGLEYIAAFFGCLYAGAVAVPAYPPRLNRSLPRLRAILEDGRPRVALTTAAILGRVEGWQETEGWLAPVRWLETDSLALDGAAAWQDPGVEQEALAFLQYTSGSTGAPKGVMLSHGNLLHNSRELRRCFGYSATTRGVIWLPPYHDMGLIGGILQPIHGGFPVTLMAPVTFLQSPLRWLETISKERATISGGPDFAYDLCVRRITPAQRETLDLSSWELAFSGAEPVRAETLERFAEAFAPCGFRRQAFYPCYGLAEATLIASGGLPGSGVVERAFEDEAAPKGKRLVGNGQSLEDQRLTVVDPETGVPCAPGVVGEIWVAGPSVAQGYWNRPEETLAAFGARLAGEGPFLRTGDLGFLEGGELFVTGRLKDLIILRGRNHYPQDIEVTVEAAHPALRPGCSAAFSVDIAGEERLVVAAELERTARDGHERVVEAVRQAVAEDHEAQVHEVVLIRVATLPKTSSGKIQRRACRGQYLAGELTVVARDAMQVETEVETGIPAVRPSGRSAALLPFLRQEAARALRLPVAQVDPDLPLAAHGLDSLGAIELKAALEAGLEIELPLTELLEGVTLAQLAEEVTERLAGPRMVSIPRRTAPGAVGESRPSMGQRALWLLDRLSPESGVNHIVAAARIRSGLDVVALKRAFAGLVQRHPALRTTFPEVRGEPVLRVHESLEIEILEEDASPETLDERMAEAAWRPFDLERGPLLRVVLFPWAPAKNGERVLLLVIHHMIGDFWSLAVLARELGRLYASERVHLGPAPFDFRDWVAWQEERLAGAEGERLWGYWLERLAGELPHLDRPADRPRPPVQSHRGGSHSLRLPADLAEGLLRFSRERQATLYVTLLTAFQVLLHRYTGQDDLLVGSPTAGRPVAEVEGTVGYFVNPVVLRAGFSAASTLDGMLAEGKRTVLGALAHADLPLALLAERLQPVRDPSRPVLFQTMFVLQQARSADDQALAAFALGTEGAGMDLGGLKIEPWPMEQRRSQFDLTLMMAQVMAQVADGLGLSLQYNADLFDHSTMVRLAGHYANLLAGIVESPPTGIYDLPLLSPADREQMLRTWNNIGDKGAGPLAGWCLHQLFEAQAARTPEAEALVCGEARLTYRELDERAGRLARRLSALGVGPEVLVAVFAERSAEMVMALLAVLKAGGAYVPIDPGYPAERVAFLLEDSRPAVLLTQERLAKLLEDEAGEAKLTPAGPGNLAYLIYTSGSTGRPKAVAIEHRNAAAMVGWALGLFTREELAGVMAATSICFDLSIFELFVPLAQGGKIVLARNALELPVLPARDEITLINTVPSAMAELVRLRGVPAPVRTVCLAGEPLPEALAEQIYAIPTVERLFNLYGPSEDTTYSTWSLVPRSGPPAIGRPIAGSQAYVLGRQFELVPVGVAGELWLGGAGLARGYLNRPELTAAGFLPDPWGEPGERLYRTGDLVRRRSSGELDFLGRIDHQVKVRGFRIELGEIEAALAACPGVEEVAVLAREDRLVAYVAGAPADLPNHLSNHLRERLPEFMVPSDFVLLPALPRTPNGKLDRKALPAPERISQAPATARGTQMEELLAGIWTELLGVEAPGAEDNFFACGGHSLMAARLVAHVRDLLGVELPLAAVFEAPTLAGLAARIERSLGHAAAPPLVPVPRTGEIPLSFAQERLWFLDQMEPGSAAYNMPFAARLDGELDVEAFRRALEEIVRRHEALRTTFASGSDGRPVQVIAPPGPLTLQVIDLPAEEVQDRLEAEARRPFDLARGPLLRALLLRLAPDSHVALVVQHHIVSDGWSIGVFLRELSALYEGTPLPGLAVQYADYALWQRSWLTIDAQLAWWRERLAGAPQVLELPADRPRPPVRSLRGGELAVRLPAGLVRDLQALGRREGATLFMVLLAAFQALLQRYTGQDDLLVGSPVAGRGSRGLEPLIGFFVNDLVLRADLSGNPAFPVFLSRVRDGALAAYAHQDVPVERLVEELRPERDRSRPPLVQVMLALQNAPLPEPRLGPVTMTQVEVGTGTAKLDLSLSLRETAEGFTGGLEYNADLFDPATVDRLLANFETLLRGISSGLAAAPQRRLSDLPLLTGAERRLLAAWNDTGTGAAETPAPQLFWEWVERTPQALAASAGGERVTYGELGGRARRLGGRLRALGVGPGSVVALCFPPGIPSLTGMLGVLAAGGAYLPLDPSHPPERRAFMLADAGVSIVLTGDEPLSGEEVDVVPDDGLAYVIYTSGSTGRPKGVAVPHRGLANLVDWHRRTYAVTPADRASVLAGPAFDASVWEVWPYLASGASLHFPDAETREQPEALMRWLAAEGITLCFLPTPLAEACLGETPPVGLALRAMLAGGDRLRFPPPPGLPFVLVNHYGPTESSVVTTSGMVEAGGGVPTIGRPIANLRVHLLDRWLNRVPVGVPGELHIAGAGLAYGYLGEPGLTAESFIPDPFSTRPGARLYKTGDLARWLLGGEIEFLGRLDHQVKVRGFRIELGEIEAVLLSHPEVREAAVLVRDGRLVAYVSGAPEELRAWLGARLPDYMVPSAFVTLPALPLTANGKLDRRALEEIEVAPQRETAALSTPAEELLAGIWEDLLGVERVGPDDDFFALGGHSLLAAQLVSRVRGVFGVEIPLRVLFDAPTVRSLAAVMESARRIASPPIVRVPRERYLPLSFSQERLWFLDRLDPGSPVYNIAAAVDFAGALDPRVLASSMSEIVRRHEALRTVFTERGGAAVQEILAPSPIPLPVVDLSGLPGESHREESERLALAAARQPFDLAQGPLLRMTLLRTGSWTAVLTLHHIVADGWSMGVFLRELSALYEGKPLPELPVQYADYAVWQRAWLESGVLEEQLAYWRERLANAAQGLDLPTDRPRPAVQSLRGGQVPVAFRTESVAAFSRRHGVTPFMTLLAAFQALLGRLAGQEDVLVGAPVANRGQAEIEGLIGVFINTLVLRGDLSGDPDVAELLVRVRETTLEAYAHQDLPFERLVEELQPERDLSRPPLVQVLLAYQSGLSLESRPVSTGTSKLDLTLSLSEELDGYLEYDSALFDEATAFQFLRRFETLLAGLLSDPSLRFSELPMLDQAERRQLLEWNGGGRFTGRPACIHQLFEAQAARTPDAPALVHSDVTLTYRELDRRAGRVARRLRALGVGPEQRVGICMERTPALVIGLLGILKAGGAYAPVDPAYPRERQAFLLEDAGAPVLLTEEALLERLPPFAGRILLLEDEGPDEGEWSPPLVEPENLAYVIYTSGSTGRPKGVAIEHASASALIRWAAEVFPREELAAVLASTSVCFDLSVFELFVPLSLGGTVVLAANALELAEGVTLINTVPSAMAELVRMGGLPASLRAVNLAGEPLPRELVDRIHERAPGVRVLNLYGPSEDTTYSTFAVIPPGEVRPPSIGRPVAGTRALVLDHWLRPAPAGVPGELFLGGAGLARGYLHRPDVTAERFVPDPWSAEPGARLYRTGDLVRYRADGNLDFLGRIDNQVKVRGFRIELGEIEAALESHPAVESAAVLALEGRLVAFIVPPAASDLRSHLQARLPEFMIPSAWVPLAVLPLTPNGKVDRRALAQLGVPRADPAEASVAPRTPTEAQLARLWAEILKLDRVGVEDDFFELGGHSLLATRVVSRVREVFGVELPVRALFESPRVAALAARIEREQSASTLPIPPLPRGGELPLSFAQERLWFLEQLDPGSPVYNMPFALRLAGRLDVPALHAALAEIVRRHEVLRTTFVHNIASEVPVDLPVIDLAALPTEAERLAVEEARRPFDLARGPLFRFRLIKMDEEHLLLVNLHHAVSDGGSIEVFLRELAALYAGLSLPALTVQYADYAAWQRAWLGMPGVLEPLLAWWREQLATAPAGLDLPLDRRRPAAQTFRGAQVALDLPKDLTRELRALSGRQGTTLFMTLLAGFHALLGRLAGQDDIVVGSPVANRNRVETEGLIGFFVNTLALRGDLSGEPGFQDLLQREREVSLGAYTHQDLPFERLVEELRPERDLSRSPVFQVMLVHQRAAPGLDLAGLTASALPVANGTSKFELTLALVESGPELAGALEYNSDLFDEATAFRLCGHFVNLLSAAVADPARPLPELPLLSETERLQLVVAWNETDPADTVSSEPVCLHQLFEGQVERSPDAPALVHGERVFTYGELDRAANGLAHRLRELGVGPEERVGILMRRTPEMVIGLLGILKAGGVYVPVDPAYPPQRQAFILEDAQRGAASPVLLTERELIAPDLIPAEAPPPCEAGPGNLAYLIYTSGSTGRPKGVAIEHASAVALVRWAREIYSDAELETVLAATSICFDLSVFELFVPLSWGGRVVLAENALELPRLAARDEVTLINTVPSAIEELVRTGLPASVRAVNLAGEPLERELVRKVHERSTARVLNLYGPSEDTTYSTFTEVPRGAVPTIGRPVGGKRAYVLDRGLRLVPVGVPGELFLTGAGLARGYLHRPELTAEKFVPDPFGPAGSRVYRTGDLARRLPSGDLEFLGRIDHQVKVRGFRIELGEIEAALGAHPAVARAVVLVRPGGQTLTAYVMPVKETPPTAELRRFLQARLPDFMIPAAFVALAELPLTPNGKVDRKALALLGPEERAAIGPLSPTEDLLAGIWGEVLGLDRIGSDANFFDLGGHSLLATRVTTKVREVFGLDLSVRALFEEASLGALAARIEGKRGAPTPAMLPILPVPRDGALALSFAQERLWFLDQLDRGSAVYNLPFALALSGPLDVPALAAALAGIVRRHEALRTTFARDPESGRPFQVIAPDAVPDLPMIELPAPEAERWAVEEARRPFDLAVGPLCRFTLLRLGDGEHRLLVNLHHTVADGWSIDVFLRELAALYGGSPLPELPVQYADYAAWQRAWLPEVLEGQIGYWREQLATAPDALDLPLDRPRPAVQSLRGSQVSAQLPESLARELWALARRQGATPFMVLMAGFQALLARLSGQEDVLVGSPVANRGHAEIEGLIGLFVNTLVLRGDLSGDPGFTELLVRTREASLEAWGHQDVPFERLVEELRLERDLSRPPLFQVMLTWRSAPAAVPALPGLATRALPTSSGTSKLELLLGLAEAGEGIEAALELDTALFDLATGDRLLSRFATLLAAAAAEPERSFWDLPLLAESERRQLVDWNRSEPDPSAVCLHQLFEEQARRTPGAEALVFGSGRLTYADLDTEASRWARRLAGLGVGPEAAVGICVERSPEMVVGMLAVLKAGGAYVPLDPEYPAQRLAWILEDLEDGSGPPLVLTQRRLLPRLGDLTARTVCLDEEWEHGEAEPLPPGLGNLAYVIYTSGSTGRPKGVAIEHRTAAALIPWSSRVFSDAEIAGVLAATSINFDLSVFELFVTLGRGGKVILAANALELPSLPSASEVTLINTVP
ncbi:MAG TPA: non-ribosomal peptide synthase/polyketide synthase, partial [Thermoanaerobaculia bacterium]|nr:non-ribosomal peptide synthase/polyketide synthase [Thermoanaerobaculia bacterium]